MLPKVANQLIHHTSRAVAVVQNQTGHTIRNVLHLQTSTPATVGNRNGTGSSSSGKSSNGAGAGGARQSGSSRFYSSYSALSRSVTQADPSLLHSATIELVDDVEEAPVASPSTTSSARRMRHRARSHSVTPGVHDTKAEKIGLLQALRQHVRARHAFATADTASARALGAADEAEAFPKQSDDTEDLQAAERIAEQEELISAFQATRTPEDAERLLMSVVKLRESAHAHDTYVYNEALNALLRIREPGQHIRTILELYNHMISHSVIPDVQTYNALVIALTDRDQELQKKIVQLEERARILIALDRFTPQARRVHEHKIAILRAENNLSSAMLLFQAACHIPRHNISYPVYAGLLRSCAYRGNVDAALRVFGHLERGQKLIPGLSLYTHLISTYDKHGDVSGAKEVFASFRKTSQSDGIHLEEAALDSLGQPKWRVQYLTIWNRMIDAYFSHGQVSDAIELVEEMVGPNATADFQCGDIPAPSPATYTRVIKGFIQCGDLDSAIIWFNRLLEQPQVPGNPYDSSLQPTKPSAQAWSSMVNALASVQRIEDLNRLVDHACRENLYTFHPLERALIVYANIRYLDSQTDLPRETILTELDQLYEQHIRDIIDGPQVTGKFWETADELLTACLAIARLRVKHGDYAGMLDLVESSIKSIHHDYVRSEAAQELPSSVNQDRAHRARRFMSNLSVVLLPTPDTQIPLKYLMCLAILSKLIGMDARQPIASFYVAAYLRSTPAEQGSLSAEEWHELLEASANVKNGEHIGWTSANDALMKPCPLPSLDFIAMVEDFAHRGFEATNLPFELRHYVGNVLSTVYDLQDAAVFARIVALGPSYKDLILEKMHVRVRTPELTHEVPVQHPETASPSRVRIDTHQSRYVEEYTVPSSGVSVVSAYERAMAGHQISVYPRIEVCARLINSLGREREVEKVHSLYQIAQLVLSAMESDKLAQSVGWFQIEDSMVIAFAHAGDLDAAHVHRLRILEQGGCPSADAYGALIERVSNTTDDTENAWRLFQEAIAHDTRPNIYLYNNMISKLARARKADQALELFAQMKAKNIRPSSVTYGALIAACCRVGDAQSAEVLFEEMIAQQNFKPRVPPYNTMMQLYTQTKPDRARALYYFNAMLRAKVNPTAHTYKLLIDAFGAIEPIDIPAMENAFAKAVADSNVLVQGTHWAALINAYGCAKKDLDKAVEVFDSISAHPSTEKARSRLPDEVVFEALMNVFVTLRRPDLMTKYQARMPALGIRMTAYIANFLIKGYAASGNIEEARALFESLADPPTGVAAPNNHVPHEDQPSSSSPVMSVPAGVVFREPSTWETMVRAELGHGNRDHAVALLQRVQARGFPPAVYNRICGIMPDVSVSPWGSESEASAPSAPSTP
ncbi:uncharacterized protein PHACADRAFT_205203 [Phanerochaete carnosa HHB-10118-sp]|uniref:Pentacotripeptide-repeat region of PRORP domain-containing protein n=1 Tax=Phanerochaete carnosa (strain HHB-10118-sp) TaxID=650164 RepID=K5W544_PHACS|nr:uncharacterized protein PHACADRAFT_205203 [Phanerochaete carnosa HHB-10118-sp]EKM59023.1 hypothetical protein PHACADRAFT_205203 [Phanerochaete carnosa HHB-10118-sp]